MKATGIVRRTDDLGRIVIPREIRRNLGIRDGDPLEIYTENNTIILQKYQTNFADEIRNILTDMENFATVDDFENTEDYARVKEIRNELYIIAQELTKLGV